jgi:hypothetical protein
LRHSGFMREVAPGIPHALWECGVVFDENERATLSGVIVRHRVGATRRPMTGSSGRSSIPATLMIESRGRGVLDRPVKPDDDRFGCLKTESHLPAAS